MTYDVVIVGGGPAGLTTALYTGRNKLKTLVIEKNEIGSLYMAHQVDNYPGFPLGIGGRELNKLMKEQATRFGVEFVSGTLLGFDPYDTTKIVKTDNGNFKCKYIVVATGILKTGKKIKGEKEFIGAGVSYCATCDGAFTKNKDVILVGQGEELALESLFLTKFAKSIKVFVTDKTFNCEEATLNALKSAPNVEIILGAELNEIEGNGVVKDAVITVDGVQKTYPTSFVFLYLGTKNSNELYGEFGKLDSHGNIIVNENMEMNGFGMFAIGDIVSGNIKQITVATADGTKVGMEIIKRSLQK